MIYAKISPTAKIIEQDSIFTGNITNLDYMTAMVRPYRVGGSIFTFELHFGIITYDQNNNSYFTKKLSKNITMESEEISTWGTDDSVLLSLIADKLGIEAIEFLANGENSF